MQTELTDIAKWLRVYNNPKSAAEFEKAIKELQKVHNKYGTIEISIIKSLIQ